MRRRRTKNLGLFKTQIGVDQKDPAPTLVFSWLEVWIGISVSLCGFSGISVGVWDFSGISVGFWDFFRFSIGFFSAFQLAVEPLGNSRGGRKSICGRFSYANRPPHSVEKREKRGRIREIGFWRPNRYKTAEIRFKKCFYWQENYSRFQKSQISSIFSIFSRFSDFPNIAKILKNKEKLVNF